MTAVFTSEMVLMIAGSEGLAEVLSAPVLSAPVVLAVAQFLQGSDCGWVSLQETDRVYGLAIEILLRAEAEGTSGLSTAEVTGLLVSWFADLEWTDALLFRVPVSARGSLPRVVHALSTSPKVLSVDEDSRWQVVFPALDRVGGMPAARLDFIQVIRAALCARGVSYALACEALSREPGRGASTGVLNQADVARLSKRIAKLDSQARLAFSCLLPSWHASATLLVDSVLEACA